MGVANQELDSILSEIGDCGRYQIRQYFLLSIPVLFAAAFTVGYVFTAGVVPHRCLVESCGDEGASSPFLPDWWQEAIPPAKDGGPSSCLTYEPRPNLTCTFDTSLNRTCQDWVFQGPERTILTEFELTCQENAWKLAIVGTAHSFGWFVGMPVNGYVSDRFGRKIGLVCALLGASVFGIARSFSSSYPLFISLEFLEAIFSGGIYGILFILAMELVGPRRRVLGGAVIVFSFALGQALLGVIAWALRDWRTILLTLYTPALLFVFYLWLIPESLRWLMSRGRLRDARELIKRAAAENRVKLSDSLEADLVKWEETDSSVKIPEEEKGDSISTALKQVFKSKRLLFRMAICSFCWVTNTLVYYGLSLNSVSLAGTDDMYLNFILVSLVEAPSYIFSWSGMTYLGRRRTLCFALLLSGVACFVNPFIPTDASGAILPLYLIGKFAITTAFDTTYVFTTEIFPTRLRTSLLSTCSMIGRIGSMLAPLTPLLTYYSRLLPMVLFGAVALVAGVLALLLPETMGQSLPDSVQEAEALGGTKSAVPSDPPDPPLELQTTAQSSSIIESTEPTKSLDPQVLDTGPPEQEIMAQSPAATLDGTMPTDSPEVKHPSQQKDAAIHIP